MKSKMELYETAFWAATGQYVKLVRYHKRFNYYDVETIAGEKASAFVHELSNFGL